MTARKLQGEIERCLKKVSEGLNEFENVYDKMMNAPTQSLKEKLETDLKKEIKKLQRCREQIKGWMLTNEVKDKRDLIETRKLIEKQMERFKTVEKEMKTKAFSKEGLAQMTKIDPKDKERMEARQWLMDAVDSLQTQIDLKEAEQEQVATQMSASGRRATKKDAAVASEKLAEIEHRLERHKWHVGRLERIMRLLENDGLTADEANTIREDIEYYVNCNDDDEFEEDDGIYENMALDDDDDLYGIVDDYGATRHGDSDSDDDDGDDNSSVSSDNDDRRSTESGSSTPLKVNGGLSRSTSGIQSTTKRSPAKSNTVTLIPNGAVHSGPSSAASSTVIPPATLVANGTGLERRTSARGNDHHHHHHHHHYHHTHSNSQTSAAVALAAAAVAAAAAKIPLVSEPVIRSTPVVSSLPRAGSGAGANDVQNAWKMNNAAREAVISAAPVSSKVPSRTPSTAPGSAVTPTVPPAASISPPNANTALSIHQQEQPSPQKTPTLPTVAVNSSSSPSLLKSNGSVQVPAASNPTQTTAQQQTPSVKKQKQSSTVSTASTTPAPPAMTTIVAATQPEPLMKLNSSYSAFSPVVERLRTAHITSRALAQSAERNLYSTVQPLLPYHALLASDLDCSAKKSWNPFESASKTQQQNDSSTASTSKSMYAPTIVPSLVSNQQILSHLNIETLYYLYYQQSI
ncbi:Not3-domain-containing protein [Ramicandelaber brevisporus]|nr:Not3-domain-containing protein [Ramicandelaber brevisporus]